MGRIQILRGSDDTRFAKPLKRALLRDSRLSYGARGLFAMLWDFPWDWVFYASHIVGMSPNGITQLKNYLKELRNVGALEILPRQLSSEEALEFNKANPNATYRAGQIVGKKWILNNPDLWAIEAPLFNANSVDTQDLPNDRFSNSRQNQQSEKPCVDKPAAKVLQPEGSANTRPPLQNDVKKSTGSSAEYVFPKQLTSKECALAKPQLDAIDPELAQAVLDELAARLNASKVTGAPLSYLRSLIKRADAGLFTPEAGIRVALTRQRDEELAAQKKAASQINVQPSLSNRGEKLEQLRSAISPQKIHNHQETI